MFFHALTDTWKIGKWISCNDNTQTIAWSHKYYIYYFCFNQDYNASYKAESKLRKSPIVETSQNELCTVQLKQNLNRFHTTRKKWLDWSREDHILGKITKDDSTTWYNAYIMHPLGRCIIKQQDARDIFLTNVFQAAEFTVITENHFFHHSKSLS